MLNKLCSLYFPNRFCVKNYTWGTHVMNTAERTGNLYKYSLFDITSNWDKCFHWSIMRRGSRRLHCYFSVQNKSVDVNTWIRRVQSSWQPWSSKYSSLLMTYIFDPSPPPPRILPTPLTPLPTQHFTYVYYWRMYSIWSVDVKVAFLGIRRVAYLVGSSPCENFGCISHLHNAS